MAKKRIHQRRKKRNRKREKNVQMATSHVPLCALGEVIKKKHLFAPIHHLVVHFLTSTRGSGRPNLFGELYPQQVEASKNPIRTCEMNH